MIAHLTTDYLVFVLWKIVSRLAWVCFTAGSVLPESGHGSANVLMAGSEG